MFLYIYIYISNIAGSRELQHRRSPCVGSLSSSAILRTVMSCRSLILFPRLGIPDRMRSFPKAVWNHWALNQVFTQSKAPRMVFSREGIQPQARGIATRMPKANWRSIGRKLQTLCPKHVACISISKYLDLRVCIYIEAFLYVFIYVHTYLYACAR